jgi:hypothetical protein
MQGWGPIFKYMVVCPRECEGINLLYIYILLSLTSCKQYIERKMTTTRTEEDGDDNGEEMTTRMMTIF